jgi:hypothetical protein
LKKDYIYVKVRFVDWAHKDAAMLVSCELNTPFLGPLKWHEMKLDTQVGRLDDLSEYEDSDAEDDHVGADEQELE